MKNRNIFQKLRFVRSNYKLKIFSTCCDKSDALPNKSILHIISSGSRLKLKNNWIKIP